MYCMNANVISSILFIQLLYIHTVHAYIYTNFANGLHVESYFCVHYQPWEILPLGTAVSAYVCSLDSLKKRVELTTFSPETWEEMMPRKSEAIIDDGDAYSYIRTYIHNVHYCHELLCTLPEESMVEDDEELGGSTRAGLHSLTMRTVPHRNCLIHTYIH